MATVMVRDVCARAGRVVVAWVLVLCVVLGECVGVVSAQVVGVVEARRVAVSAALSPLVHVRAGGLEALRGGDVVGFAGGGFDEALRSDLEVALVGLSRVGGHRMGEVVGELIAGGDVEAMREFLSSDQWVGVLAEDDRVVVELLAGGDEGLVVTQRARQALAAADGGDGAALGEFVTHGQFEALRHDQRIELYRLSASRLPSVAAGARYALLSDSDEVFASYLEFGQFVDAVTDQQFWDVATLAEQVQAQVGVAVDRFEDAVIQAQRSQAAAQVAMRGAQAAGEHAVRAGQAADVAQKETVRAGQLAALAGQAADDAAVAAGQAQQALADTVVAMNQAAVGMTQASSAAAEAFDAAAGAYENRVSAQQARGKAQQARDLAKSASQLQQVTQQAQASQGFADEALGYAQAAGGFARQASDAALRAAQGAGVSEQAASWARRGASQASAAASRAQAAADRSAGFVVQVAEAVDKVAVAAGEASEQAVLAADAADQAAQAAGEADDAAGEAERCAQLSQAAYEQAVSHEQLALSISDAALAVQELLFSQQRSDRTAQALTAAYANQIAGDVGDKQVVDWKQVVAGLLPVGFYPDDVVVTTGPVARFTGDEVFSAVVDLVEFAPEPVRSAAAVALMDPSLDALEEFRTRWLVMAVRGWYEGQTQMLWQQNAGEVSVVAGEVIDGSDDEVVRFVERDAPKLLAPVYAEAIGEQLAWFAAQNDASVQAGHGVVFEQVLVTGQQALHSNDPEVMVAWLHDGVKQALAQDARITAYNSLHRFGDYSDLEAEVLLHSGPDAAMEYLFVSRPYALYQDQMRQAQLANIDGLHAVNAQLVAQAKQAASQAHEAAAFARDQADLAGEYATQAAQSAEVAAQHAQRAQGYLEQARGYLDTAKAHSVRAASSAGAARSYAVQANQNAQIATEYSVAASGFAAQAFESAEVAHQDAQLAFDNAQIAQEAANDAFAYQQQLAGSQAWEMQLATDAGLAPPAVSTLDIVTDFLKENGIDILLELTGIQDIINCVNGEIAGCLWTLVGFVPVGKIGQVGAAVRKLVANTGELVKRLKNADADRLRIATETVGCAVAGTRTRRSVNTCQLTKRIENSNVYQLRIDRVEEVKDVEVFVDWIPESGLTSPKKRNYLTGAVEDMEKEEIARLQKIIDDVSDVNGPVKQNAKFKPQVLDTVDNQHYLTKKVPEAKPVVNENMRSQRVVGGDRAQNLLAELLAQAHHKGVDVRVNQALLTKVDGKIHQVGSKRPDFQTTGVKPDLQGKNRKIFQEADSKMEPYYSNTTYYEFDRPPSPRAKEHLGSALYAQPDATAVLVELESSMLSPKLLDDIEDLIMTRAKEMLKFANQTR